MKNGWELKKLGVVCEVIAGQSPEGKYYNNTGEGLPFYQGKK
jgi:type I restriction enzyme S subunit